jgi:hypothetical protein
VDRYHTSYLSLTTIIMNMADMSMVVMKRQKCLSLLTTENRYCIQLPKNMSGFRCSYTDYS